MSIPCGIQSFAMHRIIFTRYIGMILPYLLSCLFCMFRTLSHNTSPLTVYAKNRFYRFPQYTGLHNLPNHNFPSSRITIKFSISISGQFDKEFFWQSRLPKIRNKDLELTSIHIQLASPINSFFNLCFCFIYADHYIPMYPETGELRPRCK